MHQHQQRRTTNDIYTRIIKTTDKSILVVYFSPSSCSPNRHFHFHFSCSTPRRVRVQNNFINALFRLQTFLPPNTSHLSISPWLANFYLTFARGGTYLHLNMHRSTTLPILPLHTHTFFSFHLSIFHIPTLHYV